MLLGFLCLGGISVGVLGDDKEIPAGWYLIGDAMLTSCCGFLGLVI